MNLKETIKDLRAEQVRLQALVEALEKFQEGATGLPPATTKRAFISAPALKAKHYKWNYHGILCANPECDKGPGGTRKTFRAHTKRKIFCGPACSSHAQYLKLKQRLKKVPTVAAPKKAPTTTGMHFKHEAKHELYCQVPTCGDLFRSAKPWARTCPKHRTTYWRSKLTEVPTGMERKMTAQRPPVAAGKAVKLLPGDPLRAGGPDAGGR